MKSDCLDPLCLFILVIHICLQANRLGRNYELVGFFFEMVKGVHCKNVQVSSTRFWLPELHTTRDDLQLICPN